MAGCVSTNSPEPRSSVNPCTPSPQDSTSIVAEEYSAYPAATRCLPCCRQGLLGASPTPSACHTNECCPDTAVISPCLVSCLVCKQHCAGLFES